MLLQPSSMRSTITKMTSIGESWFPFLSSHCVCMRITIVYSLVAFEFNFSFLVQKGISLWMFVQVHSRLWMDYWT